jgi:hypothetical protein
MKLTQRYNHHRDERISENSYALLEKSRGHRRKLWEIPHVTDRMSPDIAQYSRYVWLKRGYCTELLMYLLSQGKAPKHLHLTADFNFRLALPRWRWVCATPFSPIFGSRGGNRTGTKHEADHFRL